MRVSQVMASGIRVRQNINHAVRFVMFETGNKDFKYATHGGTCFIVLFRGTPYGLTVMHVFGDFPWADLVVTDGKFGKKVAGLKAINYPSSASGAAEGSELLDVAVIEFSDDIDASFFGGTAYILDEKTYCQSSHGNQLLVHGTLKAESSIGETTIKPVFTTLELEDGGSAPYDATLRQARAKYNRPEFSAVTGLSGAPVFNKTCNAMAGIVVRGGLSADGNCTLWYVDFYDVYRLLEALHSGSLDMLVYNKTVDVPTR
jgi:hypothetical protein